MTADCF